MTNPVHESNDGRKLAALEAELRQLPPPEPPAGLEAALISAIPPVVRQRRAARRIRWAPFVAWAAAAAAACVLVTLSVRAQERAPARIVAPAPQIRAGSAGWPQASYVVYQRAWLQSPDALDEMLTRDAAVLLRPERSQSDLNVRSFLETLNLFEEKHHEKHSIRGGAFGALV